MEGKGVSQGECNKYNNNAQHITSEERNIAQENGKENFNHRKIIKNMACVCKFVHFMQFK